MHTLRDCAVEVCLNDEIEAIVPVLADALRQAGFKVATAESCTGGLIAGACTTVAG